MTTAAPAGATTTTTRKATSRPVLAALRAVEGNSLRVTLPDGLGVVTLPAPQRLAWYGGIAVVAALGFIEWPVAAVLAVGHLLAEDHHNRLIHDFGLALEEA